MSNRTYTILGATGNTGSRIAQALLSAGHAVRAVGRSKERLADLVDQGAEAWVGDATDAEFLTRAFDGADAAYTLLPSAFGLDDFRAFQDQVSRSIVAAVKGSSLSRTVLLSSLAAQLDAGTGPILGLHDHEERLELLEGDHLALRAPYFLENLFMGLETARAEGFFGSPLRPELEMPVMATADIAAEATRALLELDFSGFEVRELVGPAELSMQRFAELVAEANGSPIHYVQFPYEGALEALTPMVGADLAALYVQMYRGMNEELFSPEFPGRVVRSGQITPEAWAGAFVEALG